MLNNLELVTSYFTKKNEIGKQIASKIDVSEISFEEKISVLQEIRILINSNGMERAGAHRLDSWNSGWSQIAEKFTDEPCIDSLIPQYFGKHKYVRIKSEFYRANQIETELLFLRLIQSKLFSKYLCSEKFQAETLFEFGCGTGHNLIFARKFHPEIKLYGLDWSIESQKILKAIQESGLEENIHWGHFDYFSDNPVPETVSNSVVMTVASLEQVGVNFRNFVDKLILAKCKLVIHIEPDQMLMDSSNEVDKLSIEYAQRRGYLNGLFDYLLAKEREKKIAVLDLYRSYLGSYLLDGYSVIVWHSID